MREIVLFFVGGYLWDNGIRLAVGRPRYCLLLSPKKVMSGDTTLFAMYTTLRFKHESLISSLSQVIKT